jgi:hypothetical protein
MVVSMKMAVFCFTTYLFKISFYYYSFSTGKKENQTSILGDIYDSKTWRDLKLFNNGVAILEVILHK